MMITKDSNMLENLAIIILNYNTADKIANQVEKLMDEGISSSIFYIVDNASKIGDQKSLENFAGKNNLNFVKSAENGGSMITAEIAHSYGRDILAVPGKWSDAMSQGPNKLIKLLKAQILTKPTDVSEILGWSANQQLLFEDFYDRKSKYQNLDEEETKIIACMDVKDPVSIDMIHYSTNIAMGNLSSVLLSSGFFS